MVSLLGNSVVTSAVEAILTPLLKIVRLTSNENEYLDTELRFSSAEDRSKRVAQKQLFYA